jgi:hypothetical protein
MPTLIPVMMGLLSVSYWSSLGRTVMTNGNVTLSRISTKPLVRNHSMSARPNRRYLSISGRSARVITSA